MDYYDMPQVDKSASTYSPPVQYVPALPPRPEISKYGVSSDILTSCDWSAVIHHPAEDSEPEDLPSTVDMDAIKEPATPLPPMTPAPTQVSEEETESEEESSNSDTDSSSESNSESQGSGSGSWSSDSSDESSGKKASSSSSRSQSPPTTFSIRETNFDQGGLKLKISATKPKTPKPRSSSSSSDPYDSSSTEDEGSKESARKPEPSLPVRVKKDEKDKQPTKVEKKSEKIKRRTRVSVKQRSSKRRQVRACRRSPRAKRKRDSGNGPKEGSSSSSSSSSSSESEDDDEEEAEKDGDDIVQLAQQLGDSEHSIPISEQLQVINEEDLAAILPDVGAGSLDGFDANAQPPPADSLSSSSSDTELLPEQVVSDAISRIQIDSDTGKEEPPPSSHHSTHDDDSEREEGGGGYSSNLLEDFVEKTEILSRSGAGGSGGIEDNKAETSSTAPRRKRGRPPKPRPPPELESYPAQSNVSPDSGIQSVAGSPAHHPSPVASPDPHQKRRPPLAVNDEITKMQTTKGEMKLENGGKRGPGRPKGSGVGGRVRRKKKRGKPPEIRKPVVLPPAATELKVPPYIAGSIQATQIPSLPGITKRGRGRPKKTPPVLEPVIPMRRDMKPKARGMCPRLSVGPKGLMRVKQHKHKRRKIHSKEFTIDPKFIAEVDKLAADFDKCSITPGFKPKFDGGIPSVFRVKKIGKKRKGSERSKASDKESGPEVLKEDVNQKEKPASVAASPAHSSTITTKKRIKKSTVEIPKSREKIETANNEQRLPLKKRHYHMSSATPTNHSVNDSAEKSDSSVESAQAKPVNEKPCEKYHGTKGHIAIKGSNSPSTTTAVKSPASPANVLPPKSTSQIITTSTKGPPSVITSSKNSQSAIVPAKVSSPRPSPSSTVASSTRSAMKTIAPAAEPQSLKPVIKSTSGPIIEKIPEKQIEKQSSKSLSSNKNSSESVNVSKSPATTVSVGKSTPQVLVSSTKDKTSLNVTPCSKSATSVITSVKSSPKPTTPSSPATVALNTRSASKITALTDPTPGKTSSKIPVNEKPSEKQVGLKPSTPREAKGGSTPNIVSSKILKDSGKSTPQTPTGSKEKHIDSSTKNSPSVITSTRNSLSKPVISNTIACSTRSAAKIALANSSPKVSVTPPPVEKVEAPRAKHEKKPPAGVFEPSAKVGGAEALEKIIKTPETPVKCVEDVISKIKERLQPVKELEHISVEVEPVKTKRNLDDDEGDKPKKRRVICDVRVHVTKLSQTDFVLQNVMTNMGKHRLKVKRKKSINRTGFPVKKKKKKKIFIEQLSSERLHSSPPILEDQTKLSVITTLNDSTPSLSPVTKADDIKKSKVESQKVSSDLRKVKDEIRKFRDNSSKVKDRLLTTVKDDTKEATKRTSTKEQTKEEKCEPERCAINDDFKENADSETKNVTLKEESIEDIKQENKRLKEEKFDNYKSKDLIKRGKEEVSKSKSDTIKTKSDRVKTRDSQKSRDDSIKHKEESLKNKDDIKKPKDDAIIPNEDSSKHPSDTQSLLNESQTEADTCKIKTDLPKIKEEPHKVKSDQNITIEDQKVKEEPIKTKDNLHEVETNATKVFEPMLVDTVFPDPVKEENKSCQMSPVTESKVSDIPEVRPASKRIMELRSKTVASERRKRKSTTEEPEEASDSSPTVSEARVSIAKRLRRNREEQDDSDADSVKLRRKHPPRWKKKYLPAGLLSDYFKEDIPRKPSTSDSKKPPPYNRAEHEFGLLPPPAYCSKWVRQRKMHFQLPYDLWWLHMNNQLPGRDAVPSWNYKKIRTNVYFDVKPTLSYEAQACNCKPSSGCGEECINRMVLTECSPQFCPCNESCSNQKIQKHEWAPGLTKFMTKDKGWGVKTKYGIRKDDFILEYVGEVVSEREFKARMASRYQNDTHHYCLNLDSGLVIDGHRMGGEGRFVNHSCEPNCEMQKWCVNGLFRMALFALRDISANEELTYDYNFSLFNPSEGQPCKCGSTKCRGVIGGKWQRVAVQSSSTPSGAVVAEETKPVGVVGRPKRNVGRRKAVTTDKKINKPSKETKTSSKESCTGNTLATVAARLSHLTPVKPLSNQQKIFVQMHRCFLVRNLEKVRVLREKLKQVVKGGVAPSVVAPVPTPPPQQQVFLTQLAALSCPRSIRTRRLAQAQGNPEMTKTARLACIFKDLYTTVINAKDEKGDPLSAPFMSVPSKKKCPEYYTRIQNPLDLTMIGSNISSGVYKTVESFDDDMMAIFKNAVRFYGRTTDLGIAAARLRRAYNLAKLDSLESIEEILGTALPQSFIPPKQDPGAEEEDVIRCICGLYRDEGVMIQCERCLVWQHSWCVRANTSAEEYLCERCLPRQVDLEIQAQSEHQDPTSDQLNYITLLRGEMLLKQGDTVYVLRDIVNEESKSVPKAKHTYKTIKNWKYTDCDIFRIERLWKDKKGNRFAFGHHYLRPHETFHEPTRKFFPNELMRVPLYEVVPVDLVMGHCTVLDLNTYCKGRPIGSSPEHTYICEYRVDKNARIFAKIPKPKLSNICTKSYAFEMYDIRLKPQRNYAPHGLTKCLNVSRGRGGRSAQSEEPTHQNNQQSQSQLEQEQPVEEDPTVKRERQKSRLNGLLLKMLAKLPSKSPLDLSYLLEPGRRQRKKPPLLAS